MIFKTPWMLLLFAVLPLLRGLLARAERRQEQSAQMLRGKKDFSPEARKRKNLLILGAFASLVLALSRPCWNPRETPVSADHRDLILLLDISNSMLAGDVFPSRLEAVKITLLESLPALRGQRIGLVTFAGAATVRVPLTLDHHFVRYMLERANPSQAEAGGTSLQAAIEKTLDTLLSDAQHGRQDVIIFTDGEDHLSDMDQTAELLRDTGVRVLIIGIGDPVAGAKIPDPANPNAWMQHKGRDVITRLDEETLYRLAEASPNIRVHSSATRPPDFLSLYRKMTADTSAWSVITGTEIVYTEGYPLFLLLAMLLFFFPFQSKQITQRLPFAQAARLGLVLILLGGPGCLPQKEDPEAALFAEVSEHGESLWREAQPLIHTDSRTALSTLYSAREKFLRAALLQPGDLATASRIAGISRQISDVEESIRKQEEAEREQQKQIEEALALLRELTQRETALSRQSQQLLTRRPPSTQEEQRLAAEESLEEQRSVHQGTREVVETIQPFQTMIRKFLELMFGDNSLDSATEFDAAINLLQEAIASQETAMENLSPDQVNWPQANPALRAAAAHMQQALESLSGQPQSQPSPDDPPSDPTGDDLDFDDASEWDDSSEGTDRTLQMSFESNQGFKTDLENQSMPIPNYTAEEILMQEAANQEQRSQQKAGRAAQVEKNW